MITFLLKNPFVARIVKIIHLQLFISTVSLPLCIAWGLPLSLAAPIGNLLFAPLLSLFLFVSSIIFFLELCSLPNGFFITILNAIYSVWLYLLTFKQYVISVACVNPAPWALLTLLLGIFFVQSIRVTRSMHRSIITLLILYAATIGGLWYYALKLSPRHATVDSNRGCMHIFSCNNTITLVDPGYLGSRGCSPGYCAYTIVPAIIKQTGCLHIDHVILLAVRKKSIDCLLAINKQMKIKQVHIPEKVMGQAKMLKSSLVQQCEKQGIPIVVHKKTKRICHSDEEYIDLVIQSYPWRNGCAVTGLIDKQSFTLYAATHRYTKKKGPT